MNWQEAVVTFNCAGEGLVGVASLPEQPRALGLLIVVGGPQYRAGSHRQFVLLARQIAAAGFPVLRFDCRGMGDSSGEQRSFEEVDADIEAAIGALRAAAPSVQRVAIWGLCDAASAALLYVDGQGAGRLVAGLCLVNPWVRSAATLARTHVKHYYWGRLRQREFWAKLLTGQVGGQAFGELRRNLALTRTSAPGVGAGPTGLAYTARMSRAAANFPGQILLVLSGQDYTAKEFLEACALDQEWQRALRRTALQRLDLPEADHTLSGRDSRLAMELALQKWLDTLCVAGNADHEPTGVAPPTKEFDNAR